MKKYDLQPNISWKDVRVAWKKQAKLIVPFVRSNISNLILRRYYSRVDNIKPTEGQTHYRNLATRSDEIFQTHAYRPERQKMVNEKFLETTLLNIAATSKAARNSVRSLWGHNKTR